MKAFLLFQVSLFFLCVLSQSELIYIDQSTQTPLEEQDGSINNPYSSLQTAFRAISQTAAILVFLGQSYMVDQTITYESQEWAPTYITLRAPEGFAFNFTSEGQIVCNNYPQDLLTPAIKNVNITFAGLTIGTVSTLPLFVGTCYFTFEDIFIEELRSTLMVLGTEGSALLRNFTINNIILEDDKNLIDQDSRERVEADYLILDSVYMRNTAVSSNGQVYAMIRSFLQYKLIEVTNSVLEGIGFNIKGEQIGGNNKTDITIKNVTMRNAENFFFIESYGNLIIKDSSFLNASNRAIHVFLADENLSPVLATFDNCFFQENAAKSAGGALTFQSSSETKYQLYMTSIISGCQFVNNQASFSGGAIAFLFFKNANITVLDSEFSSNYAAEAGGAIYVNKGESTMAMTITNNVFDSNSAFTGGVFNFEFLNGAQIILENNVYTNNQVKLEGGVGFVTESVVTLSDTNSIATGNRAAFQAGSWSLESGANVTFENITFQNSTAFLRGGCIVNSGATLTLEQVSFEGSTLSAISSSGGALYVGENAIVKVSNCQFSNSLAEFGAAIAIQSQHQGSQSFDDITIECNRVRLNNHALMIKSQIILGSGNLELKDVTASNLQTPFFSQESGTVNIQNIQLRNINCAATDNSLSFCIFGVEKNPDSDGQNTLTAENVLVDSVNSTVPLITADGSTVILNTMSVNEMDLPNNVPVWDIENSILQIQNMELGDLDNNFVRSVNSDMEIVDSNFDYQARTSGGDTNEYDLIPST